MLIISDEIYDYYREVREFARSMGLLDHLQSQLTRLDNFADNSKCELFKDHAAHSFLFVIKVLDEDQKYHHYMTGGLIYEGPTQPLDGSFPALTVSLGEPQHGWSIHT